MTSPVNDDSVDIQSAASNSGASAPTVNDEVTDPAYLMCYPSTNLLARTCEVELSTASFIGFGVAAVVLFVVVLVATSWHWFWGLTFAVVFSAAVVLAIRIRLVEKTFVDRWIQFRVRHQLPFDAMDWNHDTHVGPIPFLTILFVAAFTIAIAQYLYWPFAVVLAACLTAAVIYGLGLIRLTKDRAERIQAGLESSELSVCRDAIQFIKETPALIASMEVEAEKRAIVEAAVPKVGITMPWDDAASVTMPKFCANCCGKGWISYRNQVTPKLFLENNIIALASISEYNVTHYRPKVIHKVTVPICSWCSARRKIDWDTGGVPLDTSSFEAYRTEHELGDRCVITGIHPEFAARFVEANPDGGCGIATMVETTNSGIRFVDSFKGSGA